MKRKWYIMILGGVLSFSLLEAGLQVAGYIYRYQQEGATDKTQKKQSEYRILCIGESDIVAQYPGYLEEALNERSPGMRFSVIDARLAGATTTGILTAAAYDLELYRPAMVVVMMGINDTQENVVYEDISLLRLLNAMKTFRLLKLIGHRMEAEAHTGETKHTGRDAFIQKRENDISNKEREFKERIARSVHDKHAYLDLAQLYNAKGMFKAAEKLCKERLGIRYATDEWLHEWLYVQLSISLNGQKRYGEAESVGKNILEINPRNEWAYLNLAETYKNKKDYTQTQEMYQKAAAINPRSETWRNLLSGYLEQKEYLKARKTAYAAVRARPNDWELCRALAGVYIQHRCYHEAEEMYKKALQAAGLFSGTRFLLGGQLPGEAPMRAMPSPLTKAEFDGYPGASVFNYRRIKKMAEKKGIQLVCFQYPTLSIEPLNKMLTPGEGVLFVDHEMLFKNAVQKEGYSVYFTDEIGGSTRSRFGRCTSKGSMLIAKNLADTILQKTVPAKHNDALEKTRSVKTE